MDSSKLVTVSELYVEAHHNRGDVTKFELYDVDHESWFEVPVWDLRKWDDRLWKVAADIERVVGGILDSHPALAEQLPRHISRITRTLSAEKEIDSTYHPSVESWKIDQDKVDQHLREIG